MNPDEDKQYIVYYTFNMDDVMRTVNEISESLIEITLQGMTERGEFEVKKDLDTIFSR